MKKNLADMITNSNTDISGFPGWTFDHYRREYYYYSFQEEAYVYQNGARIRTNMYEKSEQVVEETEIEVEDDVDAKLAQPDDLDDHWRTCLDSDSEDELFGDFEVQAQPQKFFVRGKVFKALWPEIVHQTVKFRPEISLDTINEPSHELKPRLFVVIKEGDNFSTCLPIYPHQRVKDNEQNSNPHCAKVRWSSVDIEDDQDVTSERSVDSDEQLPTSVVIIPKQPHAYMDTMHINYSQCYHVEHAAFISEVGHVASNSMNNLLQSWLLFLMTSVKFEEHFPDCTKQESSESATNVENGQAVSKQLSLVKKAPHIFKNDEHQSINMPYDDWELVE